MSEPIARRAVVRGQVQGVFFRDSTRQAATAAGVCGWVRNEPDGTVAVHLEGAADAVEQVMAFLHDGPDRAAVADVEVREVPAKGLRGFEVR